MTKSEIRRSIRTKLLLTMAAIAVGACLLLGFFSIIQMSRVTLKRTHDHLTSLAVVTAHTISAGLDFGVAGPVQDALSGLFGIDGVRFARVIRSDGERFVTMGDAPPAGMDIAPPPAAEVTTRDGILVARAPVRDASGIVIGTLWIGYSLDRTNRTIRMNVLLLLGLTLALAGVSVAIGLRLGRRLTTPLLQLTEAARRLGLGMFEEPLSIRSNDEVGLLADTFNLMTARLAAFRREIERTNQELEIKVRERTEELRQKNLALELQNEQVLEASRLKSAFLANVSHELRTPLNGILALSEFLADGLAGDLSQEQREHVGVIHRSGSGLLRLINDILDLSKIEAGRTELHPVTCNVLDELRRVVTELRPLAEGKGLDLRSRIAEGSDVVIDPDRVRQIVLNLTGNAIKFTERGYVEVSAWTDPADETLTVEVRDTGIGIASQDLATIFQEFRQVDGSSTRRYGGTGLGLAISQRLAEMMGGIVEVQSELGRGSQFRLRVACPVLRDSHGQPDGLADAA